MPVFVTSSASANVTAREVIRAALSFHLNRLSPGEVEDVSLFERCRMALNFIADEMNGQKSFLFREIMTPSTAITGTFGTLGTDWTTLAPGCEILGATVRYSSTLDVPMAPLTVAQYADIGVKSNAGYPEYFAHDGQATVYLYPGATAHIITLRTMQVVSEFDDLDTGYVMPKGYKSALAAMLSEKMAPSLLGSIPPAVAVAASAAKRRLVAQNIEPAIMHSDNAGSSRVARIERGF